MKTASLVAMTIAVGLALLSGCDTKKKADATLDSVKKTSDEFRVLAKNMNATINDLRAGAKSAVNTAPTSVARAPRLPASVTGGVDVSKPVAGKQGTTSVDIDSNGGPEQVTAFVPDSSADGGPAYASWQGDADSGDAGVCYLAWETGGAVWVVASACDESADGAFVCQVQGEAAACSACNIEGQCNACDMQTENLECTWPAAQAVADQPPQEEGP